MTTDVLLPGLAPSMTEGRLGKWLKQVGDAVRAGEPLAEIETEKTVTELESPADGFLVEVLVPADTDEVQVGTVLARIAARPSAAKALEPPAVRNEFPDIAPIDGAVSAHAANTADRSPAPEQTGFVASPLATRVARLLDLDVAGKAGSGDGGRVLLRDLLVTPVMPAPAAVTRASLAAATVGTTATAIGALPLVPHNAFRRVTARRLTESKQRVPHFYLQIEVNADRLLALRAEINAAAGDVASVRVSINDCVVRAAAIAIARFPACNAAWTEEGMRPNPTVDVAVAVATPNGLLTPVLRRADTLSLREVARQTTALAARARGNALEPEEYQGGSCTISNLGMYGVDVLYAIVNPPQSFILGVGRIKPAAVVRDESLVVGKVLQCTLSGDHRAIDGASGAQLLGAIRELLENPLQLLI
jgi:pyruvate dehydrogenase E2 component (dihydrolipoamide acetyltransferase)